MAPGASLCAAAPTHPRTGQIDGGHRRIRDLAIAHSHRIGQIRQGGDDDHARAFSHSYRRRRGSVAQHRAAAVDGDHVERIQCANAQAEVVGERRLAQSPFDGRGIEILDEDGIGALALIEQRLHSRQRHKDRANRALTGAERELAEIISREHLPHREAKAATQVLFPAMEGLGRYRR